MTNVKIREGESFSLVVVTESNGNRSAAYVPESIGAEDPRVVSGDVGIVLAAAIAWDGISEEFDISEEELEKYGGGYWSR
jgi:hypothetical protein